MLHSPRVKSSGDMGVCIIWIWKGKYKRDAFSQGGYRRHGFRLIVLSFSVGDGGELPVFLCCVAGRRSFDWLCCLLAGGTGQAEGLTDVFDGLSLQRVSRYVWKVEALPQPLLGETKWHGVKVTASPQAGHAVSTCQMYHYLKSNAEVSERKFLIIFRCCEYGILLCKVGTAADHVD